MIGAYATYVVQNAFRAYLPQAFDLYLVAAIPVAFAASAVIGMDADGVRACLTV